MINIDLVIEENCSSCKRVEIELSNFLRNKKGICFKSVKQSISDYETIIVPSLFIDGRLFSYGEIDLNKLTLRIGN